MIDAFGVSVGPADSKNKEAHEIFQLCRKVVKSINKSPNFKALFDEKSNGSYGKKAGNQTSQYTGPSMECHRGCGPLHTH
jgi:hypothetical protein